MEREAAANDDDLEAEDSVDVAELRHTYRLLLGRCEQRVASFKDWVATTLADTGSTLQAPMRKYINAKRTDDKRADINQPRYHHLQVLRAFLAVGGKAADSDDATLSLCGQYRPPGLPSRCPLGAFSVGSSG